MLVPRIYEWALATPDKTAILYCGKPISYSGFARRIEHARQIFSRQPLRPGSIAAITTGNMIDSWVAALALRSHGMTTFVMPSLDQIDTFGIGDRLGCIVSEADQGPGKPPRPRPPGCVGVQIRRGLYLDDPGGAIPDPREIAVVPGAHVVLTSGTTGTYKTTIIDDARDAFRIPATAKLCGFDAQSVACLFNFDLWTPAGYTMARTVWTLGGTVVIEQRPELYLALAEPSVTYAHTYPGLLQHLVAAAPRDARPRDTLAIGVGGGAVSWALAAEVHARLTPNLLVHVVSTEIGVWCVTRVETEEDMQSHCVVPGRDLQIVDDADRPLPPGQLGQIRIRADEATLGYIGNEAATQAALRNGYFYPGDLGIFLDNGRLVLQGRVSDILNIMGKKIAPELIEQALRARLGGAEVCIVSLPVPGATEELHVVIQSERPIDETALVAAWNSAVRGSPPPRFHRITELPRTAAGKIQRSVVRDRLRAGAI